MLKGRTLVLFDMRGLNADFSDVYDPNMLATFREGPEESKSVMSYFPFMEGPLFLVK